MVALCADQVRFIVVAFRDVCCLAFFDEADASELFLLNLNQRILNYFKWLKVETQPGDESFVVLHGLEEENVLFVVFEQELGETRLKPVR